MINHRSRNGSPFHAFLNIPYAEAPVGELLLALPVARAPWSGTLDATTAPKMCPQFDVVSDELAGDDDCLVVNVYTKAVLPADEDEEEAELRPVMVFIHGGGFDSGDGSPNLYGPHFFMDEDIVRTNVIVPYYCVTTIRSGLRDDELPAGAARLHDARRRRHSGQPRPVRPSHGTEVGPGERTALWRRSEQGKSAPFGRLNDMNV